MADIAVRVEHLDVVRQDNHILHDISIDVPTGRILGLLGPSGCGKTTFMRSIVGVQRITAGTVEVLGRPAGSAALRSRVGYVTQAPSVYEDLSVLENLRYFAKVLSAPPARVDEVIDLVDLGRVSSREVFRLSGGQRGRVSLGTALLSEPDLLVLDEPTVGLDPVLRHDLWALFDRLTAAGSTLVVSSHVMDEADRCHDLLLLRDGFVLAVGSPTELRSRTGTDDIEAAFLALVEQTAIGSEIEDPAPEGEPA